MKRVIVSIILVGLLVIPFSVFAEDSQPLESRKIIDSLLTSFPNLLNEDIIAQLRAQGYGYGEIAIICIIATQGNTSITDVVNYAKENNLGWGEVAKNFGVQLSKIGLQINSKDANEAGLNYLYRERYRHSEEERLNQQTQSQSQLSNQNQYQHQETHQHEQHHGQGNRGSR